MFDYYFTFSSITFAQRAQQALVRERLSGLLGRAPKNMSSKGCGYAIKLRAADGKRAAAAFLKWNTPYHAVYRVDAGGKTEATAL